MNFITNMDVEWDLVLKEIYVRILVGSKEGYKSKDQRDVLIINGSQMSIKLDKKKKFWIKNFVEVHNHSFVKKIISFTSY